MSNNNNDNNDVGGKERTLGESQSASSTTTTTLDKIEVVEEIQVSEEVEVDLRERAGGALTAEEEKVIRMLHGRSLAGHEALEFAPGATMETRMRLALIEANLLDAFEAAPVEMDPDTGAPRSVIADELER